MRTLHGLSCANAGHPPAERILCKRLTFSGRSGRNLKQAVERETSQDSL
jgi:hypothetical protein